MKKILVLILGIGLSANLYSGSKPSFFSLGTSASIPLGGFRAQTLPDGGFAMTGAGFSASGAWFMNNWLGFGARAGFNLHPVDVGSLGYQKVITDPFLDDVYIRSEAYQTFSGYVGVFGQYSLLRDLSVTGRLLGGMIYAETPYQLYKGQYYMIGEKWFEVTSAGDYEFSFMAGAGLHYDFNEHVGLAFNADYTFNQCDFEFTTFDGSIRTENKVVSFLDLGLSLVIGF